MPMDGFMDMVEIAREKLEKLEIIWIEGARIANVEALLRRLNELGSFQLMDASMILNEEHVRFACFEALRVFETGENLTGSLSMEILVKAACTTQISDAIGLLGAKEGGTDLVLVAIEAGEGSIKDAVKLIGGEISPGAFEKDEKGRDRIAREYSIREPLESGILAKIALAFAV